MRHFLTRFKAAWRMHYSFDPLLLEHTTTLVREANRLEGSGEFKRHQVYAKLIKQYPHTSHQRLALAIEVALCGL